MAKKKIVAFGAGEITPDIYERSNLQKFQTGAKTMRNAFVTKFGGPRGRTGLVTMRSIYTEYGYPLAYFSIVEKGLFFSVSRDYVQVFANYSNFAFGSVVSSYIGSTYYTEAELQTLHFTSDDEYLYIFCFGKSILKVSLTAPYLISVLSNTDFFFLGLSGLVGTAIASQVDSGGFAAPTGYDVEYGFTHVVDGVESGIITLVDANTSTAGHTKYPNNTNEANNVTHTFSKAGLPHNGLKDVPEEVYFYRRPDNAGAWGFIGSATPVDINADQSQWYYKCVDFGQEADLTNQPPDTVKGFDKDVGVDLGFGAISLEPKPKTGIVYQNRILMSGTTELNRVFGSRTDARPNMTRDFPLQDDSAVALSTGSDGGARVGRMYDARGLLITTSAGVYETPSDVLKPDTAYAIKRSNVIHDSNVPVVGMGSSVFVTDKRLSGVFKLVPSRDGVNLDTEEVSIFSAHLLEGRTIKSWCIQDTGTQILWIVRDDGILLSFSFQQDQELRSWARHDTKLGNFIAVNVIDTEVGHVLIAVVEVNGAEKIQILSRPTDDVRRMIQTDGTVIFEQNMVPDGYEITLTDQGEMSCPSAAFLDQDGLGAVGSVFRIFNFETDEYADYQVTEFVNAMSVKVELISGRDLWMVLDIDASTFLVLSEVWRTFTELSSVYMGALNDKEVAVRCDGFTHASPLNNDPDKPYKKYTVELGVITLDEENRAAFVTVGLPIVTDIETLDPDAMELYSDREKSEIVNKAWISYLNSRGFYIGSELPADDKVTGMFNHETEREESEGIEPYAPPRPKTLKQEVTFNGDWTAGQRVALRNVDPQPVGIRGIILDVETAE